MITIGLSFLYAAFFFEWVTPRMTATATVAITIIVTISVSPYSVPAFQMYKKQANFFPFDALRDGQMYYSLLFHIFTTCIK